MPGRTLAEAHARLRAGGLILISGEPGVGKSRLMQRVRMAANAFVLAGANPAGAETAPYTAIAAALRQALSSPGVGVASRPSGWPRLAGCCRRSASCSRTCPGRWRSSRPRPRRGCSRRWPAACAGWPVTSPLLLCLDDLHWADAATLSWLAGLPRQLAGSHVCLLATCRAADAGRLADVKRAFARPGLLAEAPLSRLSVEAVAHMLAHLPQRPADLPRLAARLHHATGGNAFFVLETLRALLEDGRLADPPDQLPLAPTVQAAIRTAAGAPQPAGPPGAGGGRGAGA